MYILQKLRENQCTDMCIVMSVGSSLQQRSPLSLDDDDDDDDDDTIENSYIEHSLLN